MIGWGRSVPIGLGVAALALCLVIAAEILGGPGTASPGSQDRIAAPAPQGRTGVPEAPDRHGAWLKQILARPLFSPGRHPAEVTAAGVQGLPRLTGVVVTGSQRIAIFAAPSNGHPIVAESGAHVGAYEVQAIADGGVTVVGPEGTTLLRPAFDAARVPAPTPALPRPPPVPAKRD
jgi:hypothetical protein